MTNIYFYLHLLKIIKESFLLLIYCQKREGNGTPLQYSCLENPMDRGAWWAAVYGVTQSWTRLKWLSSSSIVKPTSEYYLETSFTTSKLQTKVLYTDLQTLCWSWSYWMGFKLSLKKKCISTCVTEHNIFCKITIHTLLSGLSYWNISQTFSKFFPP